MYIRDRAANVQVLKVHEILRSCDRLDVLIVPVHIAVAIAEGSLCAILSLNVPSPNCIGGDADVFPQRPPMTDVFASGIKDVS